MALVMASQVFVMEGYAEIPKYAHWWSRAKYVRDITRLLTGVSAICDEVDVPAIIEEKIKQEMEEDKGFSWHRNFEGWTSYRKYCKPGEFDDYPEGKNFELRIDYIRDWKMEKIVKTLDGNQFAILCKELGISGGEAIAKI